MKTATLAIIVAESRVLLGRKKIGEIGIGTWNGPGGKIEEGETPLACIIRETREEMGIELDPAHLIEVATILFTIAHEPSFLGHIFRTSHFVGEPTETEEMMPAWFPVDELPFADMLAGDRDWFPRAILGDPFSAIVRYRGPGGPKGYEDTEFLPYGTPLL